MQAQQFAGTPLGGLSVRQLEVLDLLAAGYSYGEVAERLFVAAGTIGRHQEDITRVVGRTRGDLYRLARRYGLGHEHNELPPTDAPTRYRNLTLISAAIDGELDPERHELLGRNLLALGATPREVDGMWDGEPERSWQAEDVSIQKALWLAALFDQAAVITGGYLFDRFAQAAEGFIWVQPMMQPDLGTPAKFEDNYTVDPDTGLAWRAEFGSPVLVPSPR